MADNASRRGAADLGTALMIVAFAVILGFLYWLNGQAQAEKAMEVVEDTVPAAEAEYTGTATTVAPEDLMRDASPFQGQEIRLVKLPVASKLGTQGVWLELPNGNPFLVSLPSPLMADSVAPVSGDSATVVGTVVPISDSVLTAWTDSGTIGEGDRLAAEFATYFLNGTEIRVIKGAPMGAAAGPGGGR